MTAVVGVARLARISLIALIACAIGAGASVMLLDFLDKRPVKIINAAFDANSITYRDGEIQLYFDVDKVRDCPTQVTRYLWTMVDYNGKQMRHVALLPGGDPTDIGSEPFLLSLEVPKGVWDGTWYYQERDVSQCGGVLSLLRNQVSKTAPIPIIIKGTSESLPKGITRPKAPPKTKVPVDPYRRSLTKDGEPLP